MGHFHLFFFRQIPYLEGDSESSLVKLARMDPAFDDSVNMCSPSEGNEVLEW